MKFKFHRWMKMGMELEVEAGSVSEALKLAECMMETENTADMETESSGLDLVEVGGAEKGWYVVCGDSCSDGREGVWPVFYRDMNAAKACLRRFLENDKRDLCEESDPAEVEIAEDGMSAKLDDGYGRTILYKVGRIEFED